MDLSARKSGVSGAGTMGAGIAITIARAGMPTVLHDVSKEALERARRQIGEFFETSVRKGKLSDEAASRSVSALEYTTAHDALSDCDVVVEAIYEQLSAKRELLSTLDRICGPRTLFLTNTSTLSIAEIAAGSGRPDRVVGAHYCLPAQLMRLVEMSRGLLTSDESWERAWTFQRATGQHPVETRDRRGVVLNFFCVPYHNDAIRLVEAGSGGPTDIDRGSRRRWVSRWGPAS